MVNHVNQNVFEYYEFKHGEWLSVEKSIAYEWERDSYEYHELRHNDEYPDKNGLYGSYIVG